MGYQDENNNVQKNDILHPTHNPSLVLLITLGPSPSQPLLRYAHGFHD